MSKVVEQLRRRAAPMLAAGFARQSLMPMLGLALLLLGFYTVRVPTTITLPIEAHQWDRTFDAVELDPTGEPFRWMRARAQLPLPRLNTASQRLRLELQNVHPQERPLALTITQGGSSQVQLTVIPGRRSYNILLPGEFTPGGDLLKLTAETFQPVGDRRQLSLVVRQIQLTPLHVGLPWWLISATAMLTQVALLALLLRSLGGRRWVFLLAPLSIPLQMEFWAYQAYGPQAATSAWMLVLGLATVLALRQINHGRAYAEITIHPWQRSDYLLAGGLAALALLLRVWLIPHQVSILHGDDYLTGSFAANILIRNWPALYFGHHTGTLSAYMLVPVMAIAGVSHSSMLVLPLVLSMILTVALYGLGRDLAGAWGGLVAALWVAIPSATLLAWTLKPQPGYLEAITFAALALWGSVRLLWGEQKRRTTITLMAGVSLAATLAFWSGMVIASVLLVCTLLALIRWRRLPQLPLVGYGLAILIGLSWLIPTAVYVYTRPGDNPLWWVVERKTQSLPPAEALHGLATQITPLVLGIVRPWPMEPVNLVVATTLAATALLGLLLSFVMAISTARAALIPLGLTLAVVLLFSFSSFNTLLTDVRYVLPIYLALPLFAALLVTSIHKYLGRSIALGVLAAMLLAHTWSGAVGMRSIEATRERPEARLAQALAAEQIAYVHTSYWIGQTLMVESGGQILASAMLGPNRESYDLRVEQAVLAADPAQVALVLVADSPIAASLSAYLEQHAITCRQQRVDHFLFYNRCTPWPTLTRLQAQLHVQVAD